MHDKNGNAIICGTNNLAAQATATQTIKDNIISGGINTFAQAADATASNRVVSNANLVVCIRDIDVDVNVKTDLLRDLLEAVELGRTTGTPLGVSSVSSTGGVYAGPNGAWVLPPNGRVAAGDGGALADTKSGPVMAAGAGMLGVGVLGGIGLLRRRSADGTVA